VKGTWRRAFFELALAVAFILAVRWALFEPYVIPSESMVPTLLVHDHILVNKFAYGLRLPFTKTHVLRWSTPQRGDVVVFHSTESPGLFLVKRVIGLGGDVIRINDQLEVFRNDKSVFVAELSSDERDRLRAEWSQDEVERYDEGYEFLSEAHDSHRSVSMRRQGDGRPEVAAIEVPEGHLFLMGDNRDHSNDSRMFGSVSMDLVLGRASIIWLSCDQALRESSRVCHPQRIRWSRIFKPVR